MERHKGGLQWAKLVIKQLCSESVSYFWEISTVIIMEMWKKMEDNAYGLYLH